MAVSCVYLMSRRYPHLEICTKLYDILILSQYLFGVGRLALAGRICPRMLGHLECFEECPDHADVVSEAHRRAQRRIHSRRKLCVPDQPPRGCVKGA